MLREELAAIVRGVPLAMARQRLAQISAVARQSRTSDNLCRHWPIARFEQIECLAADLLESPPANLSSVAMDQLQLMREALGNNMARFNNVLEERLRQARLAGGLSLLFCPLRVDGVERSGSNGAGMRRKA